MITNSTTGIVTCHTWKTNHWKVKLKYISKDRLKGNLLNSKLANNLEGKTSKSTEKHVIHIHVIQCSDLTVGWLLVLVTCFSKVGQTLGKHDNLYLNIQF